MRCPICNEETKRSDICDACDEVVKETLYDYDEENQEEEVEDLDETWEPLQDLRIIRRSS